jgi:hypothetical protein
MARLRRRRPGPMSFPKRLLPPVLALGCVVAAPSPAAAAVCVQKAPGARAGHVVAVPRAKHVRVTLRERGAARRLVTLRAHRLDVVARKRRVVVHSHRRALGGVATRGRRWHALRLDVSGSRLSLRVDGRSLRRRVRAKAETAVKLGRGPMAGVSVRWWGACPVVPGADPVAVAPTPVVPAPDPTGCGACTASGAQPAAPVAADGRPFAAGSVWNAPLAANAALDPRSSVYVAELQRQLETTNPWINTTQHSAPIYTVPAGQPTVHVTLDSRNDPSLQAALDQVPIPADAAPAAGSDHHLVVWQPSTDTMWELWVATREADGWHADWGGRMDHVSQSPGYFLKPHPGWGATATSLPLLGGMIRVSELEAGHIDHALAFAIPHTRKWTSWSWPAQRSDGDVDSPDAIPEGARFRLDPSLDIDALRLPPATAIIAKAIQRYGMILRDKSGAVTFYAEDPAQYGANPYGRLFSHLAAPNLLFAKFPWDRLQVLALDMRGPKTGS